MGSGQSTFPPPIKGVSAPPREISRFASMALAMSTICVLAGGITSFHVGFCSVGGASIGIGWPVGVLFALTVALTMGQVASAFPRAGGPCEWAAELGGNGWGWIAGCFNLAGLITAMAAVNTGFCTFVIGAMARVLDYDPQALSPWILKFAVLSTTMAQALINHRGIRLTTLLTNFSGYLIVVVALALTLTLLISAASSTNGLDFMRLADFSNNSGPPGNGVWPRTSNLAWLFALGLLLPAYTFTAFDSSAQTAEETRDPETNVPRAIWQAVVISGVFGWLMLAALVLAAPDVATAAAAGERSFFWIIREATPYWTHAAIYTGIGVANFLCGLACVTSASRLTWAMARDRGLPFSARLRKLGTRGAPSTAIWAVGIAAAVLPFVVAYETIASVCAVFFYIAYGVPTMCGLATYGRWPRTGPWTLGRWYPPLAAVCVLGCVGLLVLAVQPPNEIALVAIPIVIAFLFVFWFGYFRLHFRDELTRALRKLESFRNIDEFTVTPLGGGLTNRNYRIEIDGTSYVLRITGADAEKLLIDRKRELIAVKAASEAGVAPKIIDHVDDHSISVTQFVHGKGITAADARRPEVLLRIAATLRAFHDHPVPERLGPFSAMDTIRYYYREAKDRTPSLPADLDEAMAILDRIESNLKSDDSHCLCHNDLLLGNFIDVGDSFLVIDWEYAGRGDRFFDLGNFAAHMQFSEADERRLLEYYFGEIREEDLKRLRLMRLVSDLREATWGYLQASASRLHSPEHYLDIGRRFLDRFLEGVRKSDLGDSSVTKVESE